MPGHLFTQYFLTDGIRQTPERQSQRSAFVAFRDEARRLFQDFPTAHNPNETQTEQDLIRPLLQLLGWTDDLPQQTSSGGENIPDLLLFPDAQAKTRATGSKASPYLKPSPSPSSSASAAPSTPAAPARALQASSPHAQILRYLRDRRNRHRRPPPLGHPHQRRRLAALRPENPPPRHRLLRSRPPGPPPGRRPGRPPHLPPALSPLGLRAHAGRRRHLLETALDQGRRYEQRVAQSLAGVVFERVFPRLLQALADKPTSPCRQSAKPPSSFSTACSSSSTPKTAACYPSTTPPTTTTASASASATTWPSARPAATPSPRTASSYYSHLTDLFAQIDQGDPSIGLPPYNGGLFAQDAAPLLNQVRLPDDVIADVVYDLSHTQDRRPAPLRQLPRHVRPATRLHLRAPAGTGTGAGPRRPGPHPPQPLRPQGQRQLLHPAGPGGPHRRPDPQAADRGTPGRLRGQGQRTPQRPPPQSRAPGRAGPPGPRPGRARSQGAGPRHGQRPLPRQRRRLPHRLHRRPDRIRPRRPRLAGRGRRLPLAPAGPRRRHPRRHPATRRRVRLDGQRGPTDRPGHHPPPRPQALHLRRRQEPAHRRTRQGLPLAPQLHRRRARSPSWTTTCAAATPSSASASPTPKPSYSGSRSRCSWRAPCKASKTPPTACARSNSSPTPT